MNEESTSRTVIPGRMGYAFEQPDILLRQRLIGLAHGLRLLGKTCLLESGYSLVTEEAYSQWFRQQGEAIDSMSRDLERWYFGTVIETTEPQARQRAVIDLIGLRNELRPLSDVERDAACGSFPQAIAGERYDFVRMLEDAARENAAKKKVEAAPGTAVETMGVPATVPVMEPPAEMSAIEVVTLGEVPAASDGSPGDGIQPDPESTAPAALSAMHDDATSASMAESDSPPTVAPVNESLQ